MADGKNLFEITGAIVGGLGGMLTGTAATIVNTGIGLLDGKDFDTIGKESESIYEKHIGAGAEIGEMAAPLIAAALTAGAGAIAKNEVDNHYRNQNKA